jgi:anti-anti-sigma regulatory factor
MPVEINQIDDSAHRVTILRVAGEMAGEEAAFAAKVARAVRDETGNHVVIDLADLDLLDSEAAPILRELALGEGFEISGIEILLQAAVDHAEGRA